MFMHSKVQVDRAEKDIFILEWYITTEGLFSSKSETKKQCISFSRGRQLNNSRVSNIESDTSQNVGLEDYNNISD